MSDSYDGGIGIQIENDNIQELQVISGTFNAEYGKALTGVVNMITKDGGNQFEGSSTLTQAITLAMTHYIIIWINLILMMTKAYQEP